MVRKSYLLPMALAGGVLLNALPSPCADSHAKDRQQIINAYKKMDTAFAVADINASMAPLAPDYTDIDKDGKVEAHNQKEERALVMRVSSYTTHRTLKSTVNGITFAPEGATAAVTLDGSFQAIKSGRPHIVTFHGTERDFWVKRGNNWLQKRSKTFTNEGALDGKPIP